LNWKKIEGDVPDDILKQMIDMSYDLIFKSLSKKAQKEISDGN
jgi:predicted DNA-binding protein (MmcQ/YjbR family)